MRITFQSQYRDGGAAIETAGERLLNAQRQVSSGRRLGKVSDDPTAASTSVAERSNIAEIDRYTRTSDSVTSRLAVVDAVLSDVVERLTTARTLTAAASGHKTAVERTALAQDLRAVRDTLLADMNTKYLGGYVFGGTATTTTPYSIPGGGTFATYHGNTTGGRVDVDAARTVAVTFDGSAITQGSDPQDLFESLEELIVAIENGDTAGIDAGHTALQGAFDRAIAAQTRVGNDMSAIETQVLRLQELKQAGTERLSRLEDVNMAEAITEMSHADATYRAALGAVSTVSRVSLLDYLK